MSSHPMIFIIRLPVTFGNIVIKDHTLAIGGIVVMSVLAYRVKKASGWTILRQKLVIHITC